MRVVQKGWTGTCFLLLTDRVGATRRSLTLTLTLILILIVPQQGLSVIRLCRHIRSEYASMAEVDEAEDYAVAGSETS